MKNSKFLFILGVFSASAVFSGALTLPVSWKWGTYSNGDYGFSVRYPLRYGFCLDQMDCADLYGCHQVSLPTTYEKAGVIFVGLTEADGQGLDKGFIRVGGNATEPFPYSFKNIRRSLKLSLGSVSKDFEGSRVVSLNGVKALRLRTKGDDGLHVLYFIPRKGKRWLEIIENLRSEGDLGYLTGRKAMTTGLKKELAAEDAIVMTLRFSR